MAAFTIPGGREKDTELEKASDSSLTYWINAKQSRLNEDPNHRYAQSDQDWIDAAIAELEKRGNGDTPPPSERGSAPQDPPAAAAPRPAAPRAAPRAAAPTGIQVVGESVAAGQGLMAALQRLSSTCTLLAPTTATDSLPEGCAVAISMVKIDPDADGYILVGDRKSPKPTDRIGLTKTAIERIGAAAGASWLPGLTGRVDDAKDPHYCHYQAWVRFQDIDGSFRDYPGECEIDLRDGSPQVQDIIRKANRPDASGKTRDPNQQLAEARKFIQRQCASKAMLVALRRPGLRHWYTREELQNKPFAVTKLIFHGRTEDPVLKRLFGQIIAERFGNAVRQLSGNATPARRHSPPPIGTVPVMNVHGESLDDPDGIASGF